MVAGSAWRRLPLVVLGALFATTVGEDAEPAGVNEPSSTEDDDPTKQLLSQLTIGMVSEVVDERTLELRDAAAKTGRKRLHIRLGNVILPGKGEETDDEHKARLTKSRAALEKLVAKQMIWWKAGPDEHQPPMPDDPEAPGLIIGDAWLIDGRHINSLLEKEGHLRKEVLYQSDLARNILTAEADAHKKDAYKELEEALKESDRQRKKEAEEQLRVEREKPEPIGFGGWLGLGCLGVIVVGALCNFGRARGNKKKGHKPRGFFGSMWAKLKGA